MDMNAKGILTAYTFLLQEISAAFAVLSCERQRSQYDLGLLDLLDYEE